MPTRVKELRRGQLAKIKPLEPSKIFAKIAACPPLMREQASIAYIGKTVTWSAIFVNGYEQSSGQVRLTFQPEPNEIKFIGATVRLSDYPWLKSTRAGETIHVRGRIKKIDTLCIELERSELLLAQPTEQQGRP